MSVLLTLDEANAFLNLDLETDDGSPPAFIDPQVPRVLMLIEQAEAVVFNYCKTSPDLVLGSPQLWSTQDLYNAQAAACLVLQALHDGVGQDKVVAENSTFERLLARMRDPAIA